MSNEIQFLLYAMPDDEGKVQVVVKDETLWCTQKAMAQLFGVDRSIITKHLKNVFETQELVESSVCAIFSHTAEDGKTYQTNFYSLTYPNFPIWQVALAKLKELPILQATFMK